MICTRSCPDINEAQPEDIFDHINGTKLDNRRENLRNATKSQNNSNRGPQVNNISGWGGYFNCKHEAAREFNRLASEVLGEYAWVNKIPNE
ncbi:HNH endonuclease [Paludifilum halophilum]|uniref:HNH nuclease domain-containing protein n=1 Tax=Paludifilum halophilum TaxID=1642702 RepID=A0A235B8L4_9BACL|nr:hypothetical protein CHM34_07040 [Paludifilum halophilum]